MPGLCCFKRPLVLLHLFSSSSFLSLIERSILPLPGHHDPDYPPVPPSLLEVMTVINRTEANSGTKQISPLPPMRHYITTHDIATGKAILHSERDARWTSVRGGEVSMSVPFTTSTFPPSLNDEADIRAHERLMASGKLGLVQEGGTVCRFVDFQPSNTPAMHRTRSLDYGIVLEGTVEMILDSGEVRTLHRSDVVVQRATMHAWRNPSSTEWARMIFVLQDCEPLMIGGTVLDDSADAVKMPARSI